MRRLTSLLIVLSACSTPEVGPGDTPSGDRHAYIWSMAGDSTGRDALLVLNADTGSADYGQVIGGVYLPTANAMPHHIERRVHTDGRLMANGWTANTNWVFDVSDPGRPVIRNSFKTAGGDNLGHIATSSIVTTENGEVFANTFGCGLYHVSGLGGDAPTATRVFTFPGDIDNANCA